MLRINELPVFILLAAMPVFCTGCEDDDDTLAPSAQVFTGPSVPIGRGAAWTEVALDAGGEPASVAVVFSEAALEDLPRGAHPHAHETLLPMPPGVEVAPYDHATLDWNAHGHAPPGVYDLSHFDVHFYFIDQAERDLIGPNDSVEFNRPLPENMLPPMYIETPAGVPRMGAHVIDGMSPEIAGTGVFTHTFIYGKYDGEINFLEPMVSEAFLRTKADVEREIRRPPTYGREGYFPGAYHIAFEQNSGNYRVELRELDRY